MTRNTAPVPNVPELPANIDDWTRYIKTERTLNDHVEDIHRVLINNTQYRDYLRAVYPEHSVEGSLYADDLMAAQMIREKAKEINRPEVVDEKLHVIVKALNVVLERYKMSRKQRRRTLAGEEVPSKNGDDE